MKMSLHILKPVLISIVALLLGHAAPAAAQAPAPPELPVDPMQSVNQAIQLIETGGDLRQADRLIRDAEIVRPEFSRIKLARGLLLLAAKRYMEAIDSLEAYNVTAEGRLDHRGYAAAGRVFLQSRMYVQATTKLEKAKELVPRDLDDGAALAEIVIDLARSHLGVGQRKEAAEAIKAAQAAAPKSGQVQAAVCELAAAADDAALAREAGEAAIKIYLAELKDNPLSESAHASILRCYQVMLGIMNSELQQHPNNGEAFVEAANLVRSMSEIERRMRLLSARSLVLQALASNPANTDWQLRAAQNEIELGALVDANKHVNAVLQAEPNNADALRLKERIDSFGR